MTVPNAVLALIRAAIPGDIEVYDGDVTGTPADRYVVYYPDNGTVKALAVCDRSDDAIYRWQTTCVAADREQAAWIAARVRDAIVDVRPTVADWVCGQIKHTYSQRPQSDETVAERPVQYMPDLYELRAARR